jgi:hypothetical protein
VTFPLSTILFTLSWPLLGASTLSGFVIVGLVVELCGIILYHSVTLLDIKSGSEDADYETHEQLELLNDNKLNDNNYGAM